MAAPSNKSAALEYTLAYCRARTPATAAD